MDHHMDTQLLRFNNKKIEMKWGKYQIYSEIEY